MREDAAASFRVLPFMPDAMGGDPGATGAPAYRAGPRAAERRLDTTGGRTSRLRGTTTTQYVYPAGESSGRDSRPRSDYETSPRRKPCATACARSRTPSLRNSRRAWVLTVSSDR
jgi:hypothetical protein